MVGLPRWLWLPILHGFVLRGRPKRSAERYAAIWTAAGSPLAVHTRRQAELLARDNPDLEVGYAMRYGPPSIAEGLEKLAPSGRVVVLPLYPQYSESTTESVRDCLPRGSAMIEDFHDHPGYVAALAAGVRRHWQARGRGERLVMSFHGLPRRRVERGDPYERQCRETARLLAGALHLDESDWMVAFQSRFGATEWLQPYTEAALRRLAASGVRRVDVVCPGFVSDCLETLEEIGIEARRVFLGAGGAEFHALPCLNESPEWIRALAEIARGRENLKLPGTAPS